MQSSTIAIFVFISSVLVLYGLVDITQQAKSDEPIEWIFPAILIGCGSIFPTLLGFVPYIFEPDDDKTDSQTDEDKSDSEPDFHGNKESNSGDGNL